MSEPAKKKAVYEDLYAIPENMVGEIIDGDLIVTPRPAIRHTHAASILGGELIPPYHFGRGNGPGGWVIYIEPELQFGDNTIVPDLAGWRIEHHAPLPADSLITIPPDWVCEILSPSTARTDKVRKMPLYARHAVPYAWLLDPIARTLEVFGLESGKWTVLGFYGEDDKVRAEPFQEVVIDLRGLWMD